MKEGFPLHPLRRKLLAPVRRPEGAAGRRVFPQLRIAARPALRGADSEKSGFLWREREGTFLSPERKVPSQNPVPSLLLVRVLFVFLVAQIDQAFRVRFG